MVRARVVVAALWLAGAAPCRPDATDPLRFASRLAELGPRLGGSEAHRQAQDLLVEALESLGASEVKRRRVDHADLINIEGVWAGRGEDEIVLSAHYDTVEQSPGAVDNASGCAVLLAAAKQLSEMPLEHTLRVVFFDGEEKGLLGSAAWVDSLGPEHKERIVASLHLDMVGIDDAEYAVLLNFRTPDSVSQRRLAPGWLVHAVLQGSRSVGLRFRVADARLSLPMQLVLRSVGLGYRSDSEPFLAAGIPAILLSDFSLLQTYAAYHSPDDVAQRLEAARLDRWTDAVSASVRRLDRLAGRPRWEDEYLVAGRVWLRRDLLWLGFLLWVVLVFRGRPGRWKGLGPIERSRRGSIYLPGFLFRGCFLLVALWIPAVGSLLVYPLAPLALWRPTSTARRSMSQALALLPAVLWAALIAVTQLRGFFQSWDLAWGKTLLLSLTFATFSWRIWRPVRTGSGVVASS